MEHLFRLLCGAETFLLYGFLSSDRGGGPRRWIFFIPLRRRAVGRTRGAGVKDRKPAWTIIISGWRGSSSSSSAAHCLVVTQQVRWVCAHARVVTLLLAPSRLTQLSRHSSRTCRYHIEGTLCWNNFKTSSRCGPFDYILAQYFADKWFLDQELISYHYASCSSSGCWGRPLQKSPRLYLFKSDLDEIWQNVLQVNVHRLMESDFSYDVILSTWRPWRHATSIRHICSDVRQFLIHSTFVLVLFVHMTAHRFGRLYNAIY